MKRLLISLAMVFGAALLAFMVSSMTRKVMAQYVVPPYWITYRTTMYDGKSKLEYLFYGEGQRANGARLSTASLAKDPTVEIWNIDDNAAGVHFTRNNKNNQITDWSTGTAGDAFPIPDSTCRQFGGANADAQKRLIKGYETIHVVENDLMSRHQVWLSPKLGCAVLEERFDWKDEVTGAMRGSFTQKETLTVSEKEPPAHMFEKPTNAIDTPPVAFSRTLEGTPLVGIPYTKHEVHMTTKYEQTKAVRLKAQ